VEPKHCGGFGFGFGFGFPSKKRIIKKAKTDCRGILDEEMIIGGYHTPYCVISTSGNVLKLWYLYYDTGMYSQWETPYLRNYTDQKVVHYSNSHLVPATFLR